LRLSVVIPSFNEASRLPKSLRKIQDFLQSTNKWLPAEIIIVDDGSTDDTARIVRQSASIHGVSVETVTHTVNRGKGAAVRTGFSRTQGECVLLTDADLSAPIQELDVLNNAFDRNTVTIGSRAVDRRLITTCQPMHRDMMGRIFNRVVRVVAVPGISDTQCGFKLFPGHLARELASVQRIDGFAYDVELLLLARSWGYSIREIGIHWGHVDASSVNPVRHSTNMFKDVLQIGLWRFLRTLPQEPSP
jgi:dolichyl-phosphate beta-glucosyltransferase